MCLAVPAKVTSVHNSCYAIAQTMGVTQKINIQLINTPLPGEYVLIHAGYAIEKIDNDRFEFLNEVLQKMIEGQTDA